MYNPNIYVSLNRIEAECRAIRTAMLDIAIEFSKEIVYPDGKTPMQEASDSARMIGLMIITGIGIFFGVIVGWLLF